METISKNPFDGTDVQENQNSTLADGQLHFCEKIYEGFPLLTPARQCMNCTHKTQNVNPFEEIFVPSNFCSSPSSLNSYRLEGTASPVSSSKEETLGDNSIWQPPYRQTPFIPEPDTLSVSRIANKPKSDSDQQPAGKIGKYGLCRAYFLGLALAVFSVVIILVLVKVIFFQEFKHSVVYQQGLKLQDVQVRSLDEYNNMLRNFDDKFVLSVLIQLAEPSDWPLGVQIGTSTNVKRLSVEGQFHVVKLVNLLSHLPQLNSLKIDNKLNYVCSETEQKLSKTHVKPFQPSVQSLTLNNLSGSCRSMLETFHDSIKLFTVESLTVSNSILDEATTVSLGKYLTSSRTYLQIIELVNVTVKGDIFQTAIAYPAAETVLYDIENVPNFNFALLFPNMKHFSFGQLPRLLSDLHLLLGCNKLKKLSAKIDIPSQQQNVSVSFIYEMFPKLEGADLTIVFQKCATEISSTGSSHKNYIKGIKTLPKLLATNLRITTNCPLIFD